MHLPRKSRFTDALTLVAVIAVMALAAGGRSPTRGATPGPRQGTLLEDAGQWDHPFLRAEPTSVAKAARDRRDGRNPIGKKFEALVSPRRPPPSPVPALAATPLRGGVRPPLWSLAARSPRGPPV